MARFAGSSTLASPRKKRRTPNTINKAGGTAFAMNTQEEIATLLMSSFMCKTAYESESDQMQRLADLVQGTDDPSFVARAAIYARDQMHMRSITHLCAAALAKPLSGLDWAARFYDKIVVRPDDMIEIYACYRQYFGKSMTGAMKRGFARVFKRLDAYQLRKYRGNGEVKLVDIMRLCHAKGPEGSPIEQLVYDKLPVAETWETKLSGAKGDSLKNAAAWGDLISEDKLGYMAMLRNLRNISQQASKPMQKLVLERLVDPERIRKSRQLPFRFYTAYKQLQSEALPGNFLSAVSRALDLSVDNTPWEFEGSTCIAADTSGSMSWGSVAKSSMTNVEAAMLFAAIVYKRIPDARVVHFGNVCLPVPFNPASTVVDMVQQGMRLSGDAGHGTNMGSVFTQAPGYDRYIVFSDMQSWDGTPPHKVVGKKTWVHQFDLAGNGTTQLPTSEKRYTLLSGWSTQALDLLKMVEQGTDQLISAINEVQV